MSTTVKCDYAQVRDDVLELSPAERFRLAKELKKDNGKSVPVPAQEDFTLLWEQNGYCCYRVNGDPIFTPEQFEEFRQNGERLNAEFENMAPEDIEREREETLRAASAFANISDESIEESVEIWRAYGLCK